mmetsp:Transcript_112238/g.317226  ORF Transcript_112238/g.317226 Transcript_112238/m.317226 type:complete len:285 (+) Transcript_112238:91-945(+)
MARSQALLFGGILAAVLLRGAIDFALPAGAGRAPTTPPKGSMGSRARDELPRQVLEVPLEAPPEEEPEPEELPEKRVPYKMTFFIHGDHSQEHDVKGANFKYMERKLQAAFDNTQEWIDKVDVRLNIDSHSHKMSPKKTGKKADAGVDADEELAAPAAALIGEEKRPLAPYLMEVTVKMHEGTVVLSKSKHAQATFTEAVDHMYDVVRRQMRKEKQKRMEKLRHPPDVVDGEADGEWEEIDEKFAMMAEEDEAKLQSAYVLEVKEKSEQDKEDGPSPSDSPIAS